jgi:hypothetical protein
MPEGNRDQVSKYKEATSNPSGQQHLLGTGPCTICDCPAFVPDYGPGPICINLNSAGGTCNHYDHEHS